MTRLFEYLVERSVRASSHAAARRDLEAPPAAHTSGDQAQSALDPARGSLAPRRRIRYERGPNPEHWSDETIAFADETLRSHSTDERLRLPEERDSFRGAEKTMGAAKARSRIELTPPRAVPVAPAASAADWPEPPSKEAGRRADPAPLLRTDPSAERAATARSIASIEPAPVRGAGSNRPPLEWISEEPTSLPREVAPVLPRRGEISPAKQWSPSRETPTAPTMRTAATDQPSIPRVQVNIGRVEVRAVYAPPPSAARRPSTAPTMSLDDYLKQREKGR